MGEAAVGLYLKMLENVNVSGGERGSVGYSTTS